MVQTRSQSRRAARQAPPAQSPPAGGILAALLLATLAFWRLVWPLALSGKSSTPSTPPLSPDTSDGKGDNILSSPAGRICIAAYKLRQLTPSDPSLAPTILTVLGLDLATPPFNCPDLGVHPGTERYREFQGTAGEFQDTVLQALPERLLCGGGIGSATDPGDAGTGHWDSAVLLAASALLDGEARTVYLREIEPQAKLEEEKAAARVRERRKQVGLGGSADWQHWQRQGGKGVWEGEAEEREEEQARRAARREHLDAFCGPVWDALGLAWGGRAD